MKINQQLSILFLTLIACFMISCGKSSSSSSISSSAPPYPIITDISLPSFSQSCLIALNVNKNSAGAAESIGVVPTPISPSSRKVPVPEKKRDSTPSFCHQAPLTGQEIASMGGTSGKPNFKITHSTSTFTFVGYSGSTLVRPSIPSSLVYGDASSKILIFVEDGQKGSINWTTVGTTIESQVINPMYTQFGVPGDLDGNEKVILLYRTFEPQEGARAYYTFLDVFNSNGADMVHINVNKFSNPTNSDGLRLVAHELHHLILTTQRQQARKSYTDIDTWVFEGLAESAAYTLFPDVIKQEAIDLIKNDTSHVFKNGYGFITQSDDWNTYALSFLFFQYCRIQGGGDHSIIKSIGEHSSLNTDGITSVVSAKQSAITSFEDLLVGFRVANLVNGSGLYGYGSESSTFNFSVKNPTNSLSNLTLKPGGAVYLFTDSTTLAQFQASGRGANVVYVRVNPETQTAE